MWRGRDGDALEVRAGGRDGMASRRSPTVHGASILSLPHPLLAPSTHQRQSARVGGGGGGGCGRCNPTSIPPGTSASPRPGPDAMPPSPHRLSLTSSPLSHPAHAPAGGGRSEEEAVGRGAWWGRGRRDGDAFEVRAGVGDCEASPRALTAHGASIIAMPKRVGRSNMALPSFRSNAIVTLRARCKTRATGWGCA